MIARFSLIAVAWMFASIASAQAPPPAADIAIQKCLDTETDRLSRKFLDGARSLDEWQRKRPRLYQERRLPTILYVCGHSDRGRDGNKSAHQDQGLWFANNGYVCLILDTLQLGEIKGLHHGTYGRIPPRWWWHAIGYTPAGVECWNGVRAIDYLLTRSDVDPERIGITGISGGGAATFWIAAADERVKAAAPVSGMSDLESYVKNKVINGHCDCMFLYNTYQWDWTTIAALIAPRPILFANSDNDSIFPMDGNRRIIEKLHLIYSKYGNPELAQEYVSVGGHAYRPDLRVAVYRFLNKYVKNDTTTPVADTRFEEIAGPELRVFPTDKDVPKDARNGSIDESSITPAVVPLPEPGKFAAWKDRLLGELRTRCLRNVDEPDMPATPFIEDGYLVGKGRSLFLLYMEPEDYAKVEVYRAFAKKFTRADGGCILYFPRAFPAQAVAEPWDMGASYHWAKKSPPNYIERAHLLLGQTTDERKLHYLLATVKKLSTKDGKDKWDGRIVGKGHAGIIAAYAALFEPAIKEVILIDPPSTHKKGPYFLNVLRVLDIPDALGMLAPMPLTIIGGGDRAFDRTAAIYRLAGAADKLNR
jgi:prolyl oligopeptidase family protein